MGQALSLPIKILKHTSVFYGGFFHYLWGAGRYSPYLTGNDSTFPYLRPSNDDEKKNNDSDEALFRKNVRVHLFSLASMFYLYRKPHYRKGTFRDDLLDNLRNVAVPGTGIPLSLFVRSQLLALTFVLTAYPAISAAAALHHWWRTGCSISDEFAKRLLAPDDWFNLWRLNCNVVGLHSYLNQMPPGYEMENKWTFLDEGDKRGVPVSPYLKSPSGIVVKHRNEEGGMGIFFYKNATDGGDWIIQERLLNSEWVSSLLPTNAPLSTFRVITQSRASLDLTSGTKGGSKKDVKALSCVFRAGRKNAATDHDSILFDVDVRTGIIQRGTTNAHWYRLGLLQWLPGQCRWRPPPDYTHHPDGNDIAVSGQQVPDLPNILSLVEESHWKLCPDVPLAGWDVVLSTDAKVPVCLLEVNLSCNFFMGTFDKHAYLDFVEDSFSRLQALRLASDRSS